jgi:hypothetical protein
MSLLMQGVSFRYHPEIRGSIASGTGSATSFVVTPSAAVQEGNLMVIGIAGSQDRVVTPSAGWTLRVQSNPGPTNELFTKIATGAEPANYTFNFNASLLGGWFFMELLRAETVYNPIDSTPSNALSSVSSIALNYSVYVPAIAVTGLAFTPNPFTSSIDNSFTAIALGGTSKFAYRRYLLPLGGQTTTWTVGGTTDEATTVMAIIRGKLIQ